MAPGSDRSSWRQAAAYVNLGTTLFACVAIGLAAGYFADRALGTLPWLLLIGVGLGIAAAGMTLYRAIKALDRMSDDDRK